MLYYTSVEPRLGHQRAPDGHQGNDGWERARGHRGTSGHQTGTRGTTAGSVPAGTGAPAGAKARAPAGTRDRVPGERRL